jgi:hypothetical protein
MTQLNTLCMYRLNSDSVIVALITMSSDCKSDYMLAGIAVIKICELIIIRHMT